MCTHVYHSFHQTLIACSGDRTGSSAFPPAPCLWSIKIKSFPRPWYLQNLTALIAADAGAVAGAAAAAAAARDRTLGLEIATLPAAGVRFKPARAHAMSTITPLPALLMSLAAMITTTNNNNSNNNNNNDVTLMQRWSQDRRGCRARRNGLW